jgi:hypothetical protein
MKILLALAVAAAMAVSATAEAATATIPGLRARDLLKHYQRLGMVCLGPAKKSGQLTWTCTQRAGTSRYVVTILGKSPTEVTSILGKATIRAKKPNPVAQSFLGYMAQIPYKGATPLKARLWARRHYGGGTTRINGVTFVVSGSPHLRQIEMKA